MREIKFRIWNKKEKKFTSDWIFNSNQKIYHNPGFYELENVELLQYVGLKDKNGLEIYEGDIVKHEIKDKTGEIIYSETGEVFYNPNGEPKVKLETSEFWFSQREADINIEVIGNVYENLSILT